MKEKILKFCKDIFGIGFIVVSVGYFAQVYTILLDHNAEGVSIFMIGLFILLNINSSFYGKFIARDKILTVGAILGVIGCALILASIWYVKKY